MSSATPVINAAQQRRARQQRRQGIASTIAFLILLAAWLFGYFTTGSDVEPYITQVLPDAQRIEHNGSLFTAYATGADGQEQIIGYAMAGSAAGYGGPLSVMVGTDPAGNVVGVAVIENRETPNFFRQLDRNRYFDQFMGTSYADALTLGDDIDAVSGATLSSEGVAQSIRQAVRTIGAQQVGATLPADNRPINFGAPEVALLALFAVSFALNRMKKRPQVRRYGRWVVLLGGVLILGFILNKPLTLANVISLLTGFWPDWHTNLYWFLLLGGILFVTLAQGKNPYCSWFCPFGGVQEMLSSISGAKVYRPRQVYERLRWIQRALAFSAIVLGLALRQPGAASFEPFGTLFDLEGSWPQWALLILIVLGSLVIYRPFCNYICPLAPVVDYVSDTRSRVKQLWQHRSKRPAETSNPSS